MPVKTTENALPDPEMSDHPQPDTQLGERARHFYRDHARRLRALAYRMLGSRADAEDIVQETWLRWAEVDEQAITRPAAFLSRTATNLCLDRLGSAVARREHYVGVSLPEPLVGEDMTAQWSPGPESRAEFAQEVSMAFMLALERLSPLERAAFLLHDVFDMDFDEIGRHLDRSPAACRQLASRARRHVKADVPRQAVDKHESRRLFEAFSAAVTRFDVDALARVLSEDAVMLADGGGKVSAVPRPLHGGSRIAKAFIGFARLPESRGWRLIPARINGLPGCLIVDAQDGDRLVQTVALAPADGAPGRIGGLYIQRNPDKLVGVPVDTVGDASR